MILLSLQDAGELEAILFKDKPVSENMWIESPLGDVYAGEKPPALPPSYHDQMQQINYLAGNLVYIQENLDKASWLKTETQKKLAFYKENIASLRADRPQTLEILSRKLFETSEPKALIFGTFNKNQPPDKGQPYSKPDP